VEQAGGNESGSTVLGVFWFVKAAWRFTMKMIAEKPMAKKSKRQVRHIHVERAANGFKVGHSLEPNKTRSPGGAMNPSYEPDPKDAVFNGPKAHKQMLAHVAGLAQQMAPDQEEGESGAPPQAMPGQAA